MTLGWAAVAALAIRASAPEPSWVQWQGPDACPDGDALQRATQSRLGRVPSAEELRVEATVEDRGAEGLAMRLRTTRNGVTDEHRMVAHDCRALVDAAALMIALSVDAVAVAERVDLSPAPSPGTTVPDPTIADPVGGTVAPEPAPTPTRTPDVAPPRRPASPRADRMLAEPGPLREALLRVGGSLLSAALPGISGGPSLTFALGWPRLRLEVGGWYAAPRRTDPQPAVVRVQMGAADIRGCARVGSLRVEVPLCWGLEAGGIRGDGEDTPDATNSTGLWLAPTASAGLHWRPTPRLALVGRVQLAVPIAYPEFEIRGEDRTVQLFEPQSISGRIFVGIEGKMWVRRDGSGR